MHELAAILAKLYTDREDFKPVVSRAGLDFSRLKSADKPYNFWYYVTEEAKKQGQHGVLIDVALEDFPNNVKLLREKVGFLEHNKASSGSALAASVAVRGEASPADIPASTIGIGTVNEGVDPTPQATIKLDEELDANVKDQQSEQVEQSEVVPGLPDKPVAKNWKVITSLSGVFILTLALVGYFRCSLGISALCNSEKLPWYVPEMVEIEGGSFLMGSENGDDDEKPVRRVNVANVWFSKTEITVAQYAECVAQNMCEAPDRGGLCNWPGLELAFEEKFLPVNCVSWINAVSYAKFMSTWLPGARLPSEAEWEYVARDGGKAQDYPWGNERPDKCEKAVTAACSEKRVLPVCSKPSGNTSVGVCDLAGNLWEWVEDDYHPDYKDAPSVVGKAWVDTPRGGVRVIRGGSFWNSPRVARVAVRFWNDPGDRSGVVGFRLARSSLSAL